MNSKDFWGDSQIEQIVQIGKLRWSWYTKELWELEMSFGGRPPNPTQTWGELWYACDQEYLLAGTFLLWKIPDTLGQTREVYRLSPTHVIPCPADSRYPDGYYRIQPLYPFGPFSNSPTHVVGATVPADQVVHTTNPAPISRKSVPQEGGWGVLLTNSWENPFFVSHSSPQPIPPTLDGFPVVKIDLECDEPTIVEKKDD